MLITFAEVTGLADVGCRDDGSAVELVQLLTSQMICSYVAPGRVVSPASMDADSPPDHTSEATMSPCLYSFVTRCNQPGTWLFQGDAWCVVAHCCRLSRPCVTLFESHYLRPKSERYGESNFDNFGSFYGYSELLQLVLAPERQKLYSPAAELIKNQADRTDLTFAGIMEAELLVMLMALISPDVRWIPQTFYYNSHIDFPFFVRATQHRHFVKLATITGISDAGALREAAKAGYERLNVSQFHGFYMLNRSLLECMNLGKLDTIK